MHPSQGVAIQIQGARLYTNKTPALPFITVWGRNEKPAAGRRGGEGGRRKRERGRRRRRRWGEGGKRGMGRGRRGVGTNILRPPSLPHLPSPPAHTFQSTPITHFKISASLGSPTFFTVTKWGNGLNWGFLFRLFVLRLHKSLPFQILIPILNTINHQH